MSKVSTTQAAKHISQASQVLEFVIMNHWKTWRQQIFISGK